MKQKISSPSTSVITGASSGIGLAMCRQVLENSTDRIVAVSRHASVSPALTQLHACHSERLHLVDCDLTSNTQRARLLDHIAPGTLTRAINCVGLLHDRRQGLWPEKRAEDIDSQALHTLFSVNAFMPVLLARDLLPLMPADRRSIFASLSARVGSISDNGLGGWYGYRAAKAAQNQLLKTFAIEMRRRRPHMCVLLLHPGTTDTPLSAPFQKNVKAEKLFPAERVARVLLSLVDAAAPEDSGRFLAWDGTDIPW